MRRPALGLSLSLLPCVMAAAITLFRPFNTNPQRSL